MYAAGTRSGSSRPVIVASSVNGVIVDSDSNEVASACTSKKSYADTVFPILPPGQIVRPTTSRSASGNGSARNRARFNTPNIATVAPIPRPRVRRAATSSPGRRRRERKP